MFVFRHQTTKIHHLTANCMIVLHRLIGSGLRVVNRSLSAQLFFVNSKPTGLPFLTSVQCEMFRQSQDCAGSANSLKN